MSGGQDIITCPKCGFEEATYDYESKNDEAWLLCDRCGYYVCHFIDRQNRKLPDKLAWIHKELGGNGCLFYGTEKFGGVGGPARQERIDAVKEHLNELDFARCSFQEDGKWFIRDLIRNETIPFSQKEIRKLSD